MKVKVRYGEGREHLARGAQIPRRITRFEKYEVQ